MTQPSPRVPGRIERIIYVLRGQRVMLDSDLAELYGVRTKALNQAVSRNPERFPDDFSFLLTEEEFRNLRSQFVTARWGGRRLPPRVFTEQGVAMLSSVLRSPRAIEVNIQIMRTFVAMRRVIGDHQAILDRLDALQKSVLDHDGKIERIFEAIRQLMRPPDDGRKDQIGFRGAANGSPPPA